MANVGCIHSVPNRPYHLLALAALFGGDFSIDWIVGISGEKTSQVFYILEEWASLDSHVSFLS